MRLSNEWLEKLNEEFTRSHIPHIQRPFTAWQRWALQSQRDIDSGDPDVKMIFEWFTANSPVGAHAVGSFYTGLFFFDAYLWPVEIPVVFGTVELAAFDSLRTMPDSIKSRLKSDAGLSSGFASVWIDCIDYSVGIDDLIRTPNGTFWQDFLKSGHQQLKSTVTLLQGNRPQPKGVEPARFATEMFLKSFISYKTGMTDDELRVQLSHNLGKALDKCLEIDPRSELDAIRPALSLFPEIKERYKETNNTLSELWRMYGMAQYAGVTVVRHLSGYDSRDQLISGTLRP